MSDQTKVPREADLLLPCTHCGNPGNIVSRAYEKHWVECRNCEAESGGYATIDAAMRAWNRRIPSPDRLARLEAVAEAARTYLRERQFGQDEALMQTLAALDQEATTS